MTDHPDTPRREFLHQLVGAGIAAASSGLLTGCAMANIPAPSSAPALGTPEAWDMSWTASLARYRMAYDSPEVESGAALDYADALFTGYKALGIPESDVTPVLILRHSASVMVLNDDMWNRIAVGESAKLKDPTTGETARRNPFINFRQDDKHSLVDEDSALDALMKRGAIVLTCNVALGGVASRLRKKETQFTRETALVEVKRNLLPGVHVMPNGIFAVAAAQDAGCHYTRVLV